jgi:multidrug efflux pump subunit AcrB
MKKLFILFLMFLANYCFAQTADINNFLVKESLLKNSKLAVVAADSLENPLENINGQYTFSISGFAQPLNFTGGIATIPQQIEKSTFVYIKHKNDKGTHSKLLYIYKKDGDLNPITISRIFLIIIPLVIIILAFAFKKFIYFALILLVIFLFFGYSNGLNIGTFFETTFDYLKNLI